MHAIATCTLFIYLSILYNIYSMLKVWLSSCLVPVHLLLMSSISAISGVIWDNILGFLCVLASPLNHFRSMKDKHHPFNKIETAINLVVMIRVPYN